MKQNNFSIFKCLVTKVDQGIGEKFEIKLEKFLLIICDKFCNYR